MKLVRSQQRFNFSFCFMSRLLLFLFASGFFFLFNSSVVFSGILKGQLKTLDLKTNVTAVLAEVDFVGLLDTSLKIHPQTRHVGVVNGASKADLYFEKKIRNAFESYANRLDFIYLTRLPLGKIAEKVQSLPENTVVLFYILMQDGEGKGFPPLTGCFHRGQGRQCPGVWLPGNVFRPWYRRRAADQSRNVGG
jgi:hypothetical protein